MSTRLNKIEAKNRKSINSKALMKYGHKHLIYLSNSKRATSTLISMNRTQELHQAKGNSLAFIRLGQGQSLLEFKSHGKDRDCEEKKYHICIFPQNIFICNVFKARMRHRGERTFEQRRKKGRGRPRSLWTKITRSTTWTSDYDYEA